MKSIMRACLVFLTIATLSLYTYSHAQPQIGTAAPDFSLQGILNKENGTISSVKDFQNEILILDFWATWCSPCVASIPKLNEFHAKYKDQGVNLLSITDESPTRLSNFLANSKMDYWVGRDPDKSIFESYGIVGRPRYFVINRLGIVVFEGGGISEEIIEEVLTTDTYRPPIDEKTEVGKAQLITDGGFTPGDDPVYNAIRLMSGEEDLMSYDRIYQFIIRPSLESEIGGYGYKYSKTHVGVTYSGGNLVDIVTFLKDLPSVLRVKNETDEQGRFDIVFWKPCANLQLAREEVLTELYRGLDIRLDSTQLEQKVKVLRTEGATIIRPEKISAGAEKTYRTLREIASVLEMKLGEYVMVDQLEEDLYIPTDHFLTPWDLEDASMEAITAYLLKYGVKIVEQEKTLTLFELKNVE
ncbi:MAG: TlpA disulfide reductase family protein [Bacteroidota bacterium]